FIGCGQKMQDKRTNIFTVSQISLLIKNTLADNLPPRLTIAGQITDLKRHQSGHAYFALKDQQAVLPCVMWKTNFRRTKFELENGLAVLATGFIDVYPPQGRYQFIVEQLIPEGLGALQLAFEQMYKRLQSEGLFEQKYKRPLPAFPMRIGILTSPTGAAIADIKDSIRQRWPCAKLFLYPVPVQGEGAAQQIAAVLNDINRRNEQLKLDVLIAGRGGGSTEDLWAFNEEILARAIFNSKIPVISAVGHEIDTTIADFVADARASTPTKAGLIAVPDITEVLARLMHFRKTLQTKILWQLDISRKELERLCAATVFRNRLLPVYMGQQQIDELMARLTGAIRSILSAAQAKLRLACEQTVRIEPHWLLAKTTVELNNLKNRTDSAAGAVLNRKRMELTAVTNRLAGLNPRTVLKRGYTITTNKKTGLPVKTPDDVQMGDSLLTELDLEKFIESQVTKK
ncbi:MAG: exodeoxyribonuclease VII large subunit, partial [Planctomycetota bacterium]